MKLLKIAIVGVGSIAIRHIRNINRCLNNKRISFQIDIYRSGFGRVLPEDILRVIANQYLINKEIVEQYDVIFITNPTSLHFESLKRFQHFGKYFFIEKPVFSSYQKEQRELDLLDYRKCYVACPLRYHPLIEYVKNNLNTQKVISVRVISSSYLPDWRPGTDYRKCYSAHVDQGGGVDIDLIHEWDYITYIFGKMDIGYCILDKMSDLEIECNDIAIYIARKQSTTFELHLDYFGRKPIRIMQLFTDSDTINCDILNGTISFLCYGKKVLFECERNEYQYKEIEHFFDIVSGKIESDSTIEHAVQLLRYAKGVF